MFPWLTGYQLTIDTRVTPILFLFLLPNLNWLTFFKYLLFNFLAVKKQNFLGKAGGFHWFFLNTFSDHHCTPCYYDLLLISIIFLARLFWMYVYVYGMPCPELLSDLTSICIWLMYILSPLSFANLSLSLLCSLPVSYLSCHSMPDLYEAPHFFF